MAENCKYLSLEIDLQMTSLNKVPRTILIINFHSSSNAGDAALLETTIRQLQSSFRGVRFIVSANYPDDAYARSLGVDLVASPAAIVGLSTKDSPLLQIFRMVIGLMASGLTALVPRIKRFIPKDWYNLLDAYQQADLVVSVPGNIFVTMGTFGWAFVVSAVSIFFALLFGKPLYIMPQSLGPVQRRWERFLLKWLYSRAQIVFTREPVSFRLGQDLGLPHKKLRHTPDLGFGFSSLVGRDEALRILGRYDYALSPKPVGVTIINQPGGRLDRRHLARYYAVMADVLSEFVKNYSVTLYFFPQVTGPTSLEDDRIATRWVIDRMSVRSSVVFIDQPLSPALLRTLFGLMEIFVATRMHSGIFAVTMGVPTLFIGYLSKTRGIVEDMGIQEWLLELDAIQDSLLWEKIEALWLQRHVVRQTLGQKVPFIIRQTLQVGQQIAQDYYSLKK